MSDGSRFTKCPICLKSFHKVSIEAHASLCIGSSEVHSPTSSINSPSVVKRPFKLSFEPSQHSIGKRQKGLDQPVEPYPYLVVLDLEWTCDNKAAIKPHAEIIEFSCVLVDTTSRPARIVSEFQRYVLPIHNPVLSEFCTDLTGITQATIDRWGVSLHDVLSFFESWLVSNKVIKDTEVENRAWCSARDNLNPFVIITWSDADLGSTLARQSRSTGIDRRPWFNKWINLRLAYRSVYQRPARGLQRCVDAIPGLKFIGRPHSAIVDARNTAQIVLNMINRQNYVFCRTTRFLDKDGYMIGSRQGSKYSKRKSVFQHKKSTLSP